MPDWCILTQCYGRSGAPWLTLRSQQTQHLLMSMSDFLDLELWKIDSTASKWSGSQCQIIKRVYPLVLGHMF